jgi:hypothetical protein
MKITGCLAPSIVPFKATSWRKGPRGCEDAWELLGYQIPIANGLLGGSGISIAEIQRRPQKSNKDQKRSNYSNSKSHSPLYGSTPGASKTFASQRCGLISIIVICSDQRLASSVG